MERKRRIDCCYSEMASLDHDFRTYTYALQDRSEVAGGVYFPICGSKFVPGAAGFNGNLS